ncbi:hypothetical protein N6H14_14670 [Paenibacillus sp. CC-CFT747]|nr:hypothetical protein N6H14_14670 [Paenibacillus sp. CC-CFT747]
MGYCNECGQEYLEIFTEDFRAYSGGVLTVTDVLVSKCACDTLETLENVTIINYFFGFLEEQGMLGDITIPLDKIKSHFDLNKILISIANAEAKQNAKLQEQLSWMKEQLGFDSTEELISKALSLLHIAIQLEDRGYTIKGYKKLGLFEGSKHLIFKIKK